LVEHAEHSLSALGDTFIHVQFTTAVCSSKMSGLFSPTKLNDISRSQSCKKAFTALTVSRCSKQMWYTSEKQQRKNQQFKLNPNGHFKKNYFYLVQNSLTVYISKILLNQLFFWRWQQFNCPTASMV